MSKDPDVNLSEEFLKYSISRAIAQCNAQLAILCLSQGETPHIRCSNTGRTLFHLVVMEATPMTEVKFVPLVFVLSNAGLDPNVADKEDLSPLQLSIRCGLLEVMTSLLKCGAEVRGNEEWLAERHGGLFFSEFVCVLRKLTPSYWRLAQQNKTFRVNVLVKSWCRINISRKGKSLIEFVKQLPGVDPKLVKHLVDNEASIELAHAVMAGDEERMKFLLCNNAADLSTKDLSHKENVFQPFSPLTLYGAALKYGHRHVLPMLRAKPGHRTSKGSANSDDSFGYRMSDQRETTREWGHANSAVCVLL